MASRTKKDYIYLRIRSIGYHRKLGKFGKFRRVASPYAYYPMKNNCLKLSTKNMPYTPAELAELIFLTFGVGWYSLDLNKKGSWKTKRGRYRYRWITVDEWEVSLHKISGVQYVACKWKPNPSRATGKNKNRARIRSRHRMTREIYKSSKRGSPTYWICRGNEKSKPLLESWLLEDLTLRNGDVVKVYTLER